jgi:poly(3-hydroxybutyrate) depolymerase
MGRFPIRPLAALSVVLAAACASSSSNESRRSTRTSATATTTTVAAAVPPQSVKVDGSLTTPDGRTRTYHLYVPASLPDGPTALLVALHGGVGNGTQFATKGARNA